MPADNQTEYPTTYTPSLLEPIARQVQRQALGVAHGSLPFEGKDLWRAYEFTWLNDKGKPEVAVADFLIAGESTNLIESKSLKLYLGSFANTVFSRRDEVIQRLESDLTKTVQAPVGVRLVNSTEIQGEGVGQFDGILLDELDIDIVDYQCNPDLLDLESSMIIQENLHTHLFRSLCPLTGQPDFASIQVNYKGRGISHAGLLRYLISYREHSEFAEQVAERIFVDIMKQCGPERLGVAARYTRRGGIEINAYRSFGESPPIQNRLWRQ